MKPSKHLSEHPRRSRKKAAPSRGPKRKAISDAVSRAATENAVPAEVSPDRIATADGQFANVLIGVTFRIDHKQIFKVGKSAAAALPAIKQQISLVTGPFTKARSDLAKVLQVSPDSLPIVWTQTRPDEVFVGVLVPDGVKPQSLFDLHSAAVQKIVTGWQYVLKDLKQSERGSKQDKQRGKQPEPEVVGASAKKLDQALRRGTKSFGVELALVANGARSTEATVTIRAPSTKKPAPIRLGEEDRVVVEIESVLPRGTCEVRPLTSRRLHRGDFTTTGPLLRLLAYLAGGPAVQLVVRRYLTDSKESQLAVDFRIERIAALSPAWRQGAPSPLDFLRQAVDQLYEMPRLDESSNS